MPDSPQHFPRLVKDIRAALPDNTLLSDADTFTELLGVDLEWLQPLYEELHSHPELSGHEEWTAARIHDTLAAFDCEIHTGIGGHGLVAIFTQAPHTGTHTEHDAPTVLFRADFDGLPVVETSGAPYASTNGAMHACGHDMHTTALLGACAVLDARRDLWSGTVIALFQPAEENATGADAMVADNLDRFIPTPDVCLSQHIGTGRAGTILSKPGPALAACDTLTITLTGRSAHGSMPHLSIDPTYLAALIVVRLQGIVGREVAPQDFAVVSVGTITSGETNNIIPETAQLVLNCRFYDDAVKARVYAAIERVVRGECFASGCVVDPVFEWSAHGELTDNDTEVFHRIRPLFDACAPHESLDVQPWTASEDFSVIPRFFGVPYLYWFIGMIPRARWDEAMAAGDISYLPSNHHPDFLPEYTPTARASVIAALAGIAAYVGIE